MKKSFFTLALLLISTFANAERFSSKIHSVSLGKKNDPHLVKLENGRVVFISGINKLFFDPKSFAPGESVEVDVDNEFNLKSVSSLPDESLPEETESMPGEKRDATVLESYEQANAIFSGMNRSWKKSTECTDRAHVWTYEEWKKHGLISKKVFLFFTNTYIRRYNYGWWFHVSPYTLVGSGEEGATEYVMDRRYTGSPRLMKSWTDVFIYSKKHGPEHCFLVKSDMYYRLPYHVRMKEDYGRIKTSFSASEVNFSYRAFNRRGAK